MDHDLKKRIEDSRSKRPKKSEFQIRPLNQQITAFVLNQDLLRLESNFDVVAFRQ